MDVVITEVKLMSDSGRCKAIVSAALPELGITINFIRIVLASDGRLFVQMPWQRRPDARIAPVVVLQRHVVREVKRQAQLAYEKAGGAPGAIPTDAPNSDERRLQERHPNGLQRRRRHKMAGHHETALGLEWLSKTASAQ
jgi:DNA-binding cell septation regulator SpoVG